jgi:hypothetical protein
MSIHVPTHVGVTINSVDLSDHFSAAAVIDTYDTHEISNFGSGRKKRAIGLVDGVFTATASLSYAAAKTYATLLPLKGTQTEVSIEPDTRVAAGATNPTQEFEALVDDFAYINAQTAGLHEFSIDWPLQTDVTPVVA